MSKKKVVISPRSMPTRSPILFCWLVWLTMDVKGAPQWLIGAWGMLWMFLILVWFIAFWHETYEDVPGFGEDKE